MKIFVSHSLSDQDLIGNIRNMLEPHGLSLLIAEHTLEMRETISNKIEKLILACDVGLILLTENGFNSKFVQQEIGYLESLKKPCLQLIQVGIEKNISGFNYGKDFILFDPNEPQIALEKMTNSLMEYWQKREHQRQVRAVKLHEQMRIAKQRQENETKIGIGILAGLIILGLSSEK